MCAPSREKMPVSSPHGRAHSSADVDGERVQSAGLLRIVVARPISPSVVQARQHRADRRTPGGEPACHGRPSTNVLGMTVWSMPGEQFEDSDLVVVKDPRAAWVPRLWSETATDLGVELSYVTMIRHPSEVIGSRSTYYHSNRPSMAPREFAVWNLCGLTLERQIRDASRAFLPYTELLADWRGATTQLLVDLQLPVALVTPAAETMIDGFVEPSAATPRSGLARPRPAPDLDRHRRGCLVCLESASGSTRPRRGRFQRPGRYRRAVRRPLCRCSGDSARSCLAPARQALRQGRREGRRKAEEARAASERGSTSSRSRFRSIRGRISRRLRAVTRPLLSRRP